MVSGLSNYCTILRYNRQFVAFLRLLDHRSRSADMLLDGGKLLCLDGGKRGKPESQTLEMQGGGLPTGLRVLLAGGTRGRVRI